MSIMTVITIQTMYEKKSGNLRNRVRRLCQLVLLINSQMTECIWYLYCVNKIHKTLQCMGYVLHCQWVNVL